MKTMAICTIAAVLLATCVISADAEVSWIGFPGRWDPSVQMVPMDFDGDKRTDLLVHRLTDGAFAKWYSDETAPTPFKYQAVQFIEGTSRAWTDADLIPGDFDNDGRTDVLVHRPGDGAFAKWFSRETVEATFNYQEIRHIEGAPKAWVDARMVSGDFDGNGTADILVYRPSDGAFAKWYSDGTVGPGFDYQAIRYIGGKPKEWVGAQIIPINLDGDNGDDKDTDILVFRASDGAFAKWYSDGTVSPDFDYQAIRWIGGTPRHWEGAELIPTDFDGDGNGDVLAFLSSQRSFAKWYGDSSVGPDFDYQAIELINGPAWIGARMLPMDFDGDDNLDVLAYRPKDAAFAKWYSDDAISPGFRYQMAGTLVDVGHAWRDVDVIPGRWNQDVAGDVVLFARVAGVFSRHCGGLPITAELQPCAIESTPAAGMPCDDGDSYTEGDVIMSDGKCKGYYLIELEVPVPGGDPKYLTCHHKAGVTYEVAKGVDKPLKRNEFAELINKSWRDVVFVLPGSAEVQNSTSALCCNSGGGPGGTVMVAKGNPITSSEYFALVDPKYVDEGNLELKVCANVANETIPLRFWVRLKN